ncbi:hypothetical protein [Amycolatopsis anabasis]|uniref:hypothetical protein n=1 Tax=Amycolatopsis anabasis TaxID=1840409 RepID=UPI00131E16F8|nr:hypothetical protein [Amycolatopsis anabasis]
MRWLLEQLYGGIDRTVAWWPVRYFVYVVVTVVATSVVTRLLVGGLVRLGARLHGRVISTRLDRWWTVRLGSRWLRVDAPVAGFHWDRVRVWVGGVLAPPHLSGARLCAHVRRAWPVARGIDRAVNVVALVGRANRLLSVVLAAAAVAWVRPPWIEVPAAWRQLAVAVSWVTHSSLQAVLASASAVIALVVIVSRGGVLDRLRFREEATRAAARHLVSLNGALVPLASTVHQVHRDILGTANRHHLLYRAVAEASDNTVTWRKDGRLDFDRAPIRLQRGSDATWPSPAAVAVDEVIDRVNAVLAEIAESGLSDSVERLLKPVDTEAVYLGVAIVGSMDNHRLELGAASDRVDAQKRFSDHLARRFERRDGDRDYDDATIEEPALQLCWEQARNLDRLALDYLFACRRIDTVCRHLQQRQGGNGWTTRIAMALTK